MNVNDYVLSLSTEETKRIKDVTSLVFSDDYDFSNMSAQETYDVMKDVARYAVCNDVISMKEICFYDEKKELSLTFQSERILDMEAKDAIAFLTNIFNAFMVSYNKDNGTITMHYGINYTGEKNKRGNW